MATTEGQPTLAAVLSADLADYQDWRRTDPAGAERGQERTARSFAEIAAKFRGETEAGGGDVMRAKFENAADAVSAAVAMHDAVDAANEDLVEEDQVDFRAAVALGPFARSGDAFAGAGVDGADDIRGVIGPGDIAITGAVYELARGPFGGSFRKAGTRTVGGVETSLYRFAPEGASRAFDETESEAHIYLTPDERTREAVNQVRHLYRNMLFGGVVIVALLLINVAASGGDFWFQWPSLVIVTGLFLQALRVVGPEGVGQGVRRCGGWLRQNARWHERAEEDLRDRLNRQGLSERAIRRRMRSVRGFRKRATSFGVILGFLFVVNLLSSPGEWWVVWPALGLAFALAMNAIHVFGVDSFLGPEWEEKKRDELRERFEREST